MPGRRGRWSADKESNLRRAECWFVVCDMTSWVVSWITIPPQTDLMALFGRSLKIATDAGWIVESHRVGMNSVFCHRDQDRRHLHICSTYPKNPISTALPPQSINLEDCIANADNASRYTAVQC